MNRITEIWSLREEVERLEKRVTACNAAVEVLQTGLAEKTIELMRVRVQLDEERAEGNRLYARAWDVLGENTELAFVLNPIADNVEKLAHELFMLWWQTPCEDGPNKEPMPSWEDVIDEGNAEEWRLMARGVFAHFRNRAGVKS